MTMVAKSNYRLRLWDRLSRPEVYEDQEICIDGPIGTHVDKRSLKLLNKDGIIRGKCEEVVLEHIIRCGDCKKEFDNLSFAPVKYDQFKRMGIGTLEVFYHLMYYLPPRKLIPTLLNWSQLFVGYPTYLFMGEPLPNIHKIE